MSELEDLIRELMDPRVMAADAFPEVILVGGPRNGDVEWTTLPLRDRLYRSEPRGLLAALEGPREVHVYQLEYVDGHPSLDDSGAYRYSYVNTETDESVGLPVPPAG